MDECVVHLRTNLLILICRSPDIWKKSCLFSDPSNWSCLYANLSISWWFPKNLPIYNHLGMVEFIFWSADLPQRSGWSVMILFYFFWSHLFWSDNSKRPRRLTNLQIVYKDRAHKQIFRPFTKIVLIFLRIMLIWSYDTLQRLCWLEIQRYFTKILQF